MINEAEHIFICILTVGLFSFVKYLLTSLPTFLLSCFFLWFFGELFIYSEYESFFVQILQIFPQPWDLPFQSINSAFDEQVNDFKVI